MASLARIPIEPTPPGKGPDENDPRSSRRRASLACAACRRRKSRCRASAGDEPRCTECVRFNTECIRDESDDSRRRAGLRRKIQELQADRNLLDDVLSSIREGEQDQIDALVHLIQDQPTLEELRSYIDVHGPNLSPTTIEQTLQSPPLLLHSESSGVDLESMEDVQASQPNRTQTQGRIPPSQSMLGESPGTTHPDVEDEPSRRTRDIMDINNVMSEQKPPEG